MQQKVQFKKLQLRCTVWGGRSSVVKTEKENWVWTEGRVLHSRETELFPSHNYTEG